MSNSDYKKTAWDVSFADQYSFRGLLSKKYGFKNLNFSIGGSSNQRQFRKAKTFFASDFFKQLKDSADKIIVLWGITSTARTEYFSLDENQIVNILLNKKSDYSKFMISNCYNHDHEVFLLANDMLHWNEYFDSLKIKNYWFDTFNHHDYKVNNPALASFEQNYNNVSGIDWPSWNDYISRNFDPMDAIGLEVTDLLKFEFAEYIRTKSIENFVINDHNRDLASQLAKNFKFDGDLSQYHYSDWKIDSDKIEFLTKLKLLNPYTFHPTKLGHKLIAEMFTPIFKGE